MLFTWHVLISCCSQLTWTHFFSPVFSSPQSLAALLCSQLQCLSSVTLAQNFCLRGSRIWFQANWCWLMLSVLGFAVFFSHESITNCLNQAVISHCLRNFLISLCFYFYRQRILKRDNWAPSCTSSHFPHSGKNNPSNTSVIFNWFPM